MKWQETYPHAVSQFQDIRNRLKDKTVTLFLDYDGTLANIVKNPDEAYISNQMRSTVKEISRSLRTAIISGRSLQKVKSFVDLEEVYYAGSHGMDISLPDGSMQSDKSSFQPAADIRPLIAKVYLALKAAVEHINGAYVEDNIFCLSVHYRNCLESFKEIESIVDKEVKESKVLRRSDGRKVFEIRPKIDWNKGKAVEFFLRSWQLENQDSVAIYMGDDTTDEDAFKYLKQNGEGFGIVVSSKVKTSDAEYSVRDPSEVLMFLNKLLACHRDQDL